MLSSSTLLLFTEKTTTIFFFSHKFMETNNYIDLNDATNEKSDLAVVNEKFWSNLKKNTDFNVKKYYIKKSGTQEKKASH